MFYIKIGLKNRQNELPRPAEQVRFVGVPEKFIGNTQYYQIYEDGMPLKGLSYQNEREARIKLRGLVDELNAVSTVGIGSRAVRTAHYLLETYLGLGKYTATAPPST